MAWLGDAARAALDDWTASLVVSDVVPPAAKDPQQAFIKELRALEKARGKKRAAAEAGVSISNWNRWLAGTRKPRPASRANIRTRYEDLRRPPLVKRRRTIEAKRRLRSIRFQIRGTAKISRREDYRSKFCEDELRSVDLSELPSVKRADLHDWMTEKIQEFTGLDVTWPRDDVDITLSG